MSREACHNLGKWRVACSLERQRTTLQATLTLGRDEPHTAFLFGRNSFVSRQHALLEATADGVTVSDLQSENGTFVLPPGKAGEQQGWRRLAPGEMARLASGDSLLLSWESICRVWLAWIPDGITMEQVTQWQTAKAAIPLVGDHTELLAGIVRIVRRTGRHILENQSRQPGSVAVNGQQVVATVLQHGDRIVLQNQVYEYTPLQLLPTVPILPMQLTVDAVAIPKRLQIHEPVQLECGQFTAVVGQSGSGKSSLIGLLAGWVEASQVHWRITMAGREMSPEQMRELLVYLPQGDILYDNLTVASSLCYAAALLAPNTTIAEHNERIGQILRRVGLWEAREQRIHSLSGGQRRRVQIAQALLHERASILLLDEPTSGLDLANDRNIMELLQRLAHQGHIVVCTTHHLGNIELCDQVIALDQGKIKNQGSPAEIASDQRIQLGNSEWCALYEKETPLATVTPPSSANLRSPAWLGKQPAAWWALLRRRFEEFCHPPGAWRQLLSQLLAIPLLIGLGIRIAWPMENGDEKRFFLCAVAAFWLAMSHAAQELQPGRYLRFVHELRYGRQPVASLVAFGLFYALVSLLQTIILIAPSIGLVERSVDTIGRSHMLPLFALLAWAMGCCGSVVGINLGIAESRLKIPIAVSVPAITIMQLLFSELVMGLVVGGSSYFHFVWNEIQGVLYSFTFSRYADMAYRSCHNQLAGIPGDFWANVAVLAGYGLLVPLLLVAVCLKTARPRE
jgi:ABC-type multidrug transport system ATPase subunit